MTTTQDTPCQKLELVRKTIEADAAIQSHPENLRSRSDTFESPRTPDLSRYVFNPPEELGCSSERVAWHLVRDPMHLHPHLGLDRVDDEALLTLRLYFLMAGDLRMASVVFSVTSNMVIMMQLSGKNTFGIVYIVFNFLSFIYAFRNTTSSSRSKSRSVT